MGTPLSPIITERGVECPVCPETSGPFPDGPTPANPIMTITDWQEGSLWDEKFRTEIEAGIEMAQGANPCQLGGFSKNLFWVWNNSAGFADVRVFENIAPSSQVFVAVPAPLCQVEYPDNNQQGPNHIAFGGTAKLTWGEILP